MPSALTSETALPVDPTSARDRGSSVGLAEVLALTAATGVGLVALASLALAHLGWHTLGAVVIISTIAAVIVLAAIRRFDFPRIRLDVAGLVPALVGSGLAGVFFVPGFRYATGDRDPGSYIEIGSAIARTHGLPFSNDLATANVAEPFLPGEFWPALYQQPGHPTQVFPQFYHLWPALLATSRDAGGFTGMFDTGPLVGVIAVLCAVAIARHVAGPIGAWAVALLLPTNMLEVWQAKYPSAEIFGQMLYLGAALGVVLALRHGWRSAAVAGGALVSLGYLGRPDGVLVVLFAWAVLCVLIAAGRFDARAGWFTAGMLALFPYGLYQAYHLTTHYTLTNGIPHLSVLLAAMTALLLVAAVLAWQRRRWQFTLRWLDGTRNRRLLGTGFIAICAVLVLLGGLRPLLFGKGYDVSNGVRTRTYNEISFVRLTWFFSLTGIALMCAGIAFVGWRRWRLDRWLLTLATTGLLALYCYNPRNSPYLMWSTRRFVTTVVPGMVILMGCGVAGVAIVLRAWLPKIAALRQATRPVAMVATVVVAALALGLTVFQASESWPLHRHNENGGSVEVETELAALAGGQRGVFLFARTTACCADPYWLFGGPMMTIVDASSAVLGKPGTPAETAEIARAVAAFGASRPVFYVTNAAAAAPAVAGITATKVRELAGALPHWEETYISRPKRSVPYPYDLIVFRLTATGA